MYYIIDFIKADGNRGSMVIEGGKLTGAIKSLMTDGCYCITSHELG